MLRKIGIVAVFMIPGLIFWPQTTEAATVLYDQDFENPNGFVDTSRGDFSQQTVNSLYGNQPSGFRFEQQFTVETLFVNGSNAFGTGYQDPQNIGGNYAIGFLSDRQNDLLGLAFDVGSNDFLNIRLDISSIDVDRRGGPFIPPGGAVPEFEFTLFDNPSGALGLGSGSILATQRVSGTISDPNVFEWTEALLSLDASSATNGNVILRADLIAGNYAAFDNLRIVASETSGDLGVSVPEPTSTLAFGIISVAALALRRKVTSL